ncbi:MAG: response regulator [Anaerolineae bacterium]
MSHVLLIEDDPGIANSMEQILNLAGYTTTLALEGVAGIEAAQTHKPDLILCDLMMPMLSGYEVLKSLRADPTTSTIPIIIVSALTDRIQQRRGMELGADDYLTKPFDPEELISAVQTQIEKHHSLTDQHELSLRLMRNNIAYALPHELRTPLAQIMGYAQLLEMEEDPVSVNTVHEFAAHITKASERLQHFIENYLVFAQLEILSYSQEEMEKLKSHQIADVVPVISRTAESRAEHHKRVADLQMHVVPARLRIAEANLEKIITELADNAFKFSAAGTPVVVTGVCAESSYQLTIRDFGRGMHSDQLKLLDAYMQFDRAVYEQQGIGLGYYIAKRLVEIYGGTVSPSSQPEAGTTVTLNFPVG